jgi:hypothetical protein
MSFCNSRVDSGLLCDITSEIDRMYGGRRDEVDWKSHSLGIDGVWSTMFTSYWDCLSYVLYLPDL